MLEDYQAVYALQDKARFIRCTPTASRTRRHRVMSILGST